MSEIRISFSDETLNSFSMITKTSSATEVDTM
jgi:hypothetical protein